MQFDLKRPCKDCPFIKGTTMVLNPGRMEGIAEHLSNDFNVFPCHKTTHQLAPEGREEEYDSEEGGYSLHGREQACMGALAYTLKHHGNLPVLARLAIRGDPSKINTIRDNFHLITPPGKWRTSK